MRRGSIDPWKYIYTETGTPVSASKTSPYWSEDPSPPSHPLRKTGIETLPGVENLPRMRAAAGPCDPERPRIFHMYWAGPFTDKPYFTLLSYLFTQPLRLNETAPLPADACAPPQFWIWINPGVHASVPNPTARDDMIATLGKNPWSAPFLHDRFHDVIKFRLWNTTERLDQLDELAGWRESPQLGKLHVDAAAVALLQQATETDSAGAPVTRVAANAAEEDALGQLKAADGAQVIMSDVARFLVTHAFGGAYVDVDNVLLRDWEELWGWRGAWATRWSYHPWYNTAILRMHKGSPLGSFLLKTIMRVTADDQPWHPVAITHYLEDARLDPLLVRIPDAVFDPTFLTFEGLQRARPPFPAWSWNSP
jgi:WD repeat and SOF domain-containing protein 1